jgi:uncharacterized protein involved in response to NO
MAMALWIFMLQGTIVLPTALSPVSWHFHELLFGFVAAAIVGFLLTAIPNWTGRLPLRGWPLGALFLLWVLGRVAVAVSAWAGTTLTMAADLSFLVVFIGVAGREIVAARCWRNLPVLIAIALLIAANAIIHMETAGWIEAEEVGKRLAISTVVMLISLIGGRIIPSFTTNWLQRRGAAELPSPFGHFDGATLGITALALSIWIGVGSNTVSGAVLIAAACAQSLWLARWRGGATSPEPLLWILHVAYAWLPIGIALLGAAAWMPDLGTIAIHALTVGAMGTMILAVMTRASLGHTNQELTAGFGTSTIFVFILFAAMARIAAPFLGLIYSVALPLAGGAWIAAFGLFVVLYAPLYLRR